MADIPSSGPRVTVIIEHDDETTLVTFTGPHQFESGHLDDEWRQLRIAGVPDSYTYRQHPSRQAWLADTLADIVVDLIHDHVYDEEPEIIPGVRPFDTPRGAVKIPTAEPCAVCGYFHAPLDGHIEKLRTAKDVQDATVHTAGYKWLARSDGSVVSVPADQLPEEL